MSASKSSPQKLSLYSINNSSLTNTNMVAFKTFRLGFNTKCPAKNGEWNMSNRHLWEVRTIEQLFQDNKDKKGVNYGIPCGMVNNIICVDMDLYKLKTDSEFIKVFGEDYIKLFNTFSVKTTSGGEHLYFKWDRDITQTTCGLHQIDIRNKGGYCVAPGSSVNGSQYTILNNTKVKKIPEKLKTWLLNNIYNTKKRTKKPMKTKPNGDIIIPKNKNEIEPQDSVDLSSYNYTMSDEIIWSIIEGLDKKYFNDYSDFLLYATWLKTINRKDIFEKANKKYIKIEDKSTWRNPNGWDTQYEKVNHKYINTFPLILRESRFLIDDISEETRTNYQKYETEDTYIQYKIKYYDFLNRPDLYTITKGKDPVGYIKMEQEQFYNKIHDLVMYLEEMELLIKKFFGYYMLKPLNNHTIKPDKIISGQRYLDGDTPGSFFNNINNRYVMVKSDTGTGKTTAFKNYAKQNHTRFISVVSRLSLGKEQSIVFNKAEIEDCIWFKDIKTPMWDYEGANVVIQIDSIMKIANFDFSGYTIYLDEFNSLIEYFVDCPCLNDKRVSVYKILNGIFKTAERVIMTDADIGDNSIRYLKQLKLNDMIFIQNDYKHNKDIIATEIFTDTDLINELHERLSVNQPFMVCCDSKNVSEIIHHSLNRDKRIGLFTSDTDTNIDIDLDSYDYVIFSPKIVYGLDSLMKRPVYCVMKEHTISPLGMIQQACRCRNIEYLKYFFGRKSHGLYKYESPEEVLNCLNEKEKHTATAFSIIADDEEEKNYKELLAHHLYNMDCYNSNKFSHFINLLKQRGFVVDINRKKSKGSFKEGREEIKKYKMNEIKELYENNQVHIDTAVEEWKTELQDEIKDWSYSIEKTEDNEYELEQLDKCINAIKEGIDSDKWKTTRADKLLSVYPQVLQNRIKILSIRPEKVLDYWNILIDGHQLTRHFLVCDFFFKEDDKLQEKLDRKKDFACAKGSSPIMKMIFLKKVLNQFEMKMDLNDLYLFNLQPEKIPFFDNKKLLEEYRTVFNDRNKKLKISFHTPYEAQKLIVKMFKNIFGSKIIESKKSTKKMPDGKVKSITYYNLNNHAIQIDKEILDFRKTYNSDNEIYERIKY